MTTEVCSDGHQRLLRSDLPRQERLLAGVAEATRQLLAIADFDTAVNGALEAIATAADIDRIYIDQYHVDEATGRETMTCPYEWTAPNIVKCSEIPGRFPMDLEPFGDLIGLLKARRPMQVLAQELSQPAQDLQDLDKALSLLAVPIFIDGEMWGCVGFDDCTTERVWSEVEVTVLETAAASFAGALERRNSLTELERRDALLKSVNEAAQCLVATDELEQSIPQALKILGEGTKQDRVYVFKNLSDSKTGETLWDMPFEWNALGIPSAREYGMHLPIPMSAFPPQITETVLNGQVFRYLVRDLDGMALDLNQEAQALSLVGVPFKVEGHWWGVLGFDDCKTERVWSDAEVLVLETAAACIGSAIERDRSQKAREAAERGVLLERAKAAQVRGAELAKMNSVQKETLDMLVTEPELSRFLGYVLQAIAQQFDSPFLEYWRTADGQITYLEQVVIQGEVLAGEQLAGHHGVDGLTVPPEIIKVDDLSQRTKFIEIEISPTNPFIAPIYDNIYYWCQHRGVELPGQVINFPIVLGDQSLGAIAIFLPKAQHLSEETIKLGYVLTNQVALAVQLTQLAEENQQMAVLEERDRAIQQRTQELESHNRVLEGRDRILQATTTASSVLLNGEDFDASVNTALKLLGESIGLDRIAVGQQINDPTGNTSGYIHFLYEWDGFGVTSQIQDHEDMIDFHWDAMGLRSWCQASLRGEAFGQVIDELPEPFRSLMESVDVKSIHNVPIFVEGVFWGVFGIDNCHEKRLLSSVELTVIKTAANCVGGAIARDRDRKEREAAAQARVAELAERDRILEATAAAANVMLTEEDFDQAVKAALQIVGEGLEVDRINLGQYFEATSPQEVGYHDLSNYEWTSAKTILQAEHPEFSRISDTGMEPQLEALHRGEVFGGIVEEFPEPFRSSQLELGVKSTYAVPIRADGRYWGMIGLDDCHRLTRRSEAELEALITLANCIGNAVDREHERKAKEVAAAARLTELAERDRILETTATAANVMLTDEDFNNAVHTALAIVGNGLDMDRVLLGQYVDTLLAQDQPYIEFLYEWVSEGTNLQTEHPELVKISNEGLELINEALSQGKIFGGIVDELPEPFRTGQKELGVKSTYAIPIMVGGDYWGVIALDDCNHLTRRTEAELEALKTLANCIGNAIERDRTRMEKEAAAQARVTELAERDRILEATAAAANIMLTDKDFNDAVNTALRIVGEGLTVDRIALGQYTEANSAQEVGYHRFLFEWDSDETSVQIEHSELATITDEGVEHLVAAMKRGEVSGGVVDEMKEPFRSKQKALGVQSTYAVPIRINSQYWGMIGFDDCHAPTRRSEAEIEALMTLANCIGNAIERDRTRKEREAAAQARAAELEAHNLVLENRDRILEATAEAANVLLTDVVLDDAINTSLQIVGEAVQTDRVAIIKHLEKPTESSGGQWQLIYEWTSSVTSPVVQSDYPELLIGTYEGIKDIYEMHCHGEGFSRLIHEFPEPFREGQALLGVQVMSSLPIMLEGQYWGAVTFDDCSGGQRRGVASLAVLKTLTDCIGNAIERDRARKEREAAAQGRAAELEAHNLELANRDRILEATAAAANVLLTDDDFEGAFNRALQIIGEAVGTDRVGLAQHLAYITEAEPGHWRLIHEWHAPGITPVTQIFYPEPMQGTYAGAELLYEMHQRGEGFSLTTAQMLEPFRSNMASVGVQTLHAVPILLRDQYWGTVVFGDCRQQQQRSLAELAALQTVADCIGNAIDRDRNRKEREAVTQARAAELKKNNEILSQRDRWLSATAAATEKLLSENDLKNAVKPALQEIGESIGVDRVGIMYSCERDGQKVLEIIEEWIHPSQPVQSESEELSAIPCHLIGDQHFKTLLNGQWYGGDIEDFPEPFRSSQKEIGVQSTYSVPIFIDGQFWGLVGIDHCRKKKLLTQTEIAVFQTIASCFASAIQRDQIRKARETAERKALIESERAARAAELEAANQVLTTRDRWLETTAIAANQLLSTADIMVSVNIALQTIGSNLDSDRLGVMRYFPDATELGYFQVLYEWDAAGTTCQISNLELNQMPASDFADWTHRLMVGHPVGGPVEQQSEPFRSKMQSLGTLATYAVPIFIEAEFWGAMFMDYCRELRQLTPGELAVFNTAATCIGSAIHREQMRREREQAERDTLLQQEREKSTQRRAATLEIHNRQLQQRDRLLNSVNAAAQSLVANEDLEAALPTMLQILGKGTAQCRAYILKNSEDQQTGKLLFNLMLEWDAPHIPPKMEVGARFPVPIDQFPDHLTGPLKVGRATQFLASDLDGISPVERQSGQALSLVGVPITVGGEWWGLLGLDDCVEERIWSDTEIAVLETAATAVGGALERDRSRQDREAAERTALIERERAARADELEVANQVLQTRERWLETTTTAANVLLSGTDVSVSVNAALQTIGENLECDRVYIFQKLNRSDFSEDSIGSAHMTYEWVAKGQEPHINIPHLANIPADRFQDTFAQLLEGQWFGGIVEELSEPMRSYQRSFGNKSFYVVPVFVNSEVWGVVGIVHCQQVKKLSSEEIAVFQTAATCIGSAIYQESFRRDQAAQERAKLLGAVAEAANLLLRSTDYPTVLPEVIRLVGEAVECDRCGIGQDVRPPNSKKSAISIKAEWEWRSAERLQASEDFCPYGDKLFFWEDAPYITEELKKGEVVNILVADLPEPDRSFLLALGNLAECFVPITVEQKLWGFVSFDNCGEPRLYDEAEIAILRVAAESIAAAIARQSQDEALRKSEQAILSEREKAARERAAELAKTNEAIARSLTSLVASPELDQFLGAIIAEMARQLNACKVHLFLYDEPTHILNQRVAVQDGQIYLGVGPNDPEMFSQPIPADITPGWDSIINGERPVTYDETQPYDEDLWWPETLGWHKAQGHKAVTAIPMKAGDVPIGYIGFCFYDRTVLSDEQLEFMQALANQAIVAIQLTRLADEAKQAAILQEQEKAARERATELAKTNEAISQTLDALTTEPELDRFLGQILTQIIEQIGADDTHLFLYDAETHTLHSQLAVQNNTVYSGNAPGDPELFYADIPVDITAFWEILIRAPKPVTLDENNPDSAEFFWPTTMEWHTSRGHQSATCACMKIGNQPIGFIGFAFCDRTVLSTEQLEFVQALTNQATLAIHLTRLAEQARTNALTDERNRLAREIHDTLAQAFTGISLQLEAAKNILVQKPDTAKSYLDQARDLARQGLSEARRSVHALRSQALETESLVRALQKNLTQMTLNTSLQTEFQLQGTPNLLEEGLQLNLLRIGQEAITNALRHAQAQTLTVTLTFTDQQVGLCIVDDGVGFEPQDSENMAGFGLMGIRERTARYHGQVQIISYPGEGTTIEVKMPV